MGIEDDPGDRGASGDAGDPGMPGEALIVCSRTPDKCIKCTEQQNAYSSVNYAYKSVYCLL